MFTPNRISVTFPFVKLQAGYIPPLEVEVLPTEHAVLVDLIAGVGVQLSVSYDLNDWINHCIFVFSYMSCQRLCPSCRFKYLQVLILRVWLYRLYRYTQITMIWCHNKVVCLRWFLWTHKRILVFFYMRCQRCHLSCRYNYIESREMDYTQYMTMCKWPVSPTVMSIISRLSVSYDLYKLLYHGIFVLI